MFSKSTKQIIIISTGVLLMSVILDSCMLFKTPPNVYVIDPVCGMKVNKAEVLYDWKYEGTKYYFDSYSCQETFKMNPKKFLENKCADTK